jgi:hypothetical protein
MRNAALASSLVVAAIAVSDARAQDIVLVDDGLFVETFGLSDGTFKNTQASMRRPIESRADLAARRRLRRPRPGFHPHSE